MDMRKRYAIVGAGGRALMFINAMFETYQGHSQLVGLCDMSRVRMDWHNQHITKKFGSDSIPTYHASEFEKMIRETKPHTIIVCTIDAEHHTYIIKAMTLGCDVVCEKPMTIDAAKTQAIFDVIERTGQKLRVAFNYRYAPTVTKVRELVMDGRIGQPLAVDFTWVLNTSHGADYFRRWHREKDKSGGLLVHKATHHFDLVNWWVQSIPELVYAHGELKFYGKANAQRRGESYNYTRYTDVPEAKNDPFALDLRSEEGLAGRYLEAEKETGYVRDRNVFDDNITIEDTMHVLAKYRNGVMLNYSLLAYSPWEGSRVAITGSKGRIELMDEHGAHIVKKDSQVQSDNPKEQSHTQKLMYYPMFGQPSEVAIPEGKGSHGGADGFLLEQIFSSNPPIDPYQRDASHIEGAASLLLGICANESIALGKPVICDDIFRLPME